MTWMRSVARSRRIFSRIESGPMEAEIQRPYATFARTESLVIIKTAWTSILVTENRDQIIVRTRTTPATSNKFATIAYSMHAITYRTKKSAGSPFSD
jgi:hypothetical protein